MSTTCSARVKLFCARGNGRRERIGGDRHPRSEGNRPHYLRGPAHRGGRVCAFDIEALDARAIVELRATLAPWNDRFIYHRTDVTSEAEVVCGVAAAIEAFGAIGILVNNAGQGPDSKPLEEMSLLEWEETLRLNLTSVAGGSNFPREGVHLCRSR